MEDPWTARLSEYLDDELDQAERLACEAHVASCPTCRPTLHELRQVVARARALSDERPASDLWPGIEPTLGRRSITPLRRVLQLRMSLTLPQAVAASVLLVVAAAALVWLVQSATETGPADSAAGGAGQSTTVVRANLADESYDRAIADLERIVAERRDRLDPTTVASIERSLRTIDRAMAEARQALEADPGNVYLNGYFAATRRRKLELLRQVSALAHIES